MFPHETLRSGARVEYALPVWSDRQGLIGKCGANECSMHEICQPAALADATRLKRLHDELLKPDT